MTKQEERRQVLRMLAAGRIDADEAERLLGALADGRPAASASAEAEPGWLHVRVTDAYTGSSEVDVRVPLGVVRGVLGLVGRFVPDEDLEQLAAALQAGQLGRVIDIVDEGRRVEVVIQ